MTRAAIALALLLTGCAHSTDWGLVRAQAQVWRDHVNDAVDALRPRAVEVADACGLLGDDSDACSVLEAAWEIARGSSAAAQAAITFYDATGADFDAAHAAVERAITDASRLHRAIERVTRMVRDELDQRRGGGAAGGSGSDRPAATEGADTGAAQQGQAPGAAASGSGTSDAGTQAQGATLPGAVSGADGARDGAVVPGDPSARDAVRPEAGAP